MGERFPDAALRHLETAEVLEFQGRIDDSAYHYGLVGEMALKAAVTTVLGALPRSLKLHINHPGRIPLQLAIAADALILTALADGRVGGALKTHLLSGSLGGLFVGWSLDIRYHGRTCCPVVPSDLAAWKMDAVTIYNNGSF
jgi:hypothetical protein